MYLRPGCLATCGVPQALTYRIQAVVQYSRRVISVKNNIENLLTCTCNVTNVTDTISWQGHHDRFLLHYLSGRSYHGYIFWYYFIDHVMNWRRVGILQDTIQIVNTDLKTALYCRKYLRFWASFLWVYESYVCRLSWIEGVKLISWNCNGIWKSAKLRVMHR